MFSSGFRARRITKSRKGYLYLAILSIPNIYVVVQLDYFPYSAIRNPRNYSKLAGKRVNQTGYSNVVNQTG